MEMGTENVFVQYVLQSDLCDKVFVRSCTIKEPRIQERRKKSQLVVSLTDLCNFFKKGATAALVQTTS